MKTVLELKNVTKNIRVERSLMISVLRFVKARYSVFWDQMELGKRQPSG